MKFRPHGSSHGQNFEAAGLVPSLPSVTLKRSAPRAVGSGSILKGLTLLLVLGLFSGCETTSIRDPARAGPFFNPTNHKGEPSLGGLRRVVLLPLFGGDIATAESVTALDSVLLTELQQQQRFEVIFLSREDCRRRFRVSEVSSVAALPHDFFAVLRRDFAADGVIFVDLTVFRPYRPLAIGLRAKLATLEGGRLVWTFDNVFSTADPAVANSARRHFLKTDRGEVPADLSSSVLQSPARFGSYVAAATFSTLPPVVPPVNPVKPVSAPTKR